MAIVNAYVATDMSAFGYFYGEVEVANESTIKISDGYLTSVYGGNFYYDFYYEELYGTLGRIINYAGDLKTFEATGINRDANIYFNYSESDDIFGGLRYVLSGSDKFQGSNFNDTLLVYGGADLIDGNGGHDYIQAGSGDDTVFGDTGNDRAFGESGNDLLTGDRGWDVLGGGVGDDLVHGGDGNDRVFGEAGNDVVVGGTGEDLVAGQQGFDKIVGGTAKDTLSGGADADHFVFRTWDEAGKGTGRDIVIDFSASDGDRIDLRTIDADPFLEGDQAFSFIGTLAFSGSAGELAQRGNVLNADMNGDLLVDMQIELNVGVTALTEASFLL